MIARSSLMPVWNWINDVLLPQESARFGVEAKALILAAEEY